MNKASNRLISLDAFRGFTIMLMILVNNPGSWSYSLPPLRHASWHGCTPTDLVFPFFLFIMGVAMAFSFAKRSESTSSSIPLYYQILKRTFLLIAIGWLLSLYPRFDFAHLRIPGVLPRIGLCYFFSSMIIMNLKLKGQVVTAGLLLLIYWALMVLVPFAGKLPDHWAYESNFAKFFDKLVIPGHTWKPDFDPEGFISTLPAIVQTLLGYFTGLWLRCKSTDMEKTVGMFITANISIVMGLVWSYWMPINKQLWTGSYVFYTVGIALHFLAISYWLIDIKGYKKFTRIFIIFGSNAIFAFAGSSFLAKNMYFWKIPVGGGGHSGLWAIFYEFFSLFLGPWVAALILPLLLITFWFMILRWMFNRKIFLKL